MNAGNKTRTRPECAISRRNFLKIGGAGIFVFFTAGALPFVEQTEAAPLPDDFNAFLKIGEDGRVACFTGKIEMGQGIVTSLAQMCADELDVALESVDMVMGDTRLCPWDRGTFGSLTTRVFGPKLREAAAEARAVLLQLAAERLGEPVSKLAAENGEVYVSSESSRRVGYGQLTEGKRIERRLSGEAPVKKPEEFKVMRRSVLRSDAREKVTGSAKYAGDILLPDMLYASLLRPPVHGATLRSVNTAKAEAMEGVRVVQEGDFVAVLHPLPDIAEKALQEVEARFDIPDTALAKVDENSIFSHLLEVAPEGNVIASQGSLEQGRQTATVATRTTFYDGYVAHAPIEPHAATAQFIDGQATVWPSAQTPFPVQEQVAQALGIPSEKVHVISPYIGGGFGGKTRNLQAVEAARLAKMTGRPVQVAWTREEEFFYDSYRPAAVVQVDSGVDAQGRLTFWDFGVYFAGDRGAETIYAVPNQRTTAYAGTWSAPAGAHPFAVGAWRAPANNTNTFARESQVEIMAAAAGKDPLAFRLANLKDKRMRDVLQAAAQKYGWKEEPFPRSFTGTGRGIACGIDAGTYVATIAEVEVDTTTGAVQVTRVVAAQDMGLCVNPEGAAIQMEGCITMGLGYALSEELHFRGGDIQDRNFHTYEIPRFSWLPVIETVILDRRHQPPHGGGEPAIITMGGALANAIFDACGARMLRLPMTPSRIKQALAGSA